MDFFSRFGPSWFMLISVAFGQGIETEWTQTIRTSHPCGFSAIGTVDQHDNLWLLCPKVSGGGVIGSLLQIDSAGKVRLERELTPTLPATANGLTMDIHMASSGPTIGVLVSTTRWEGRAASFEGAYFMLLRSGELMMPVRISAPGPQFLELVPYHDGEYLKGGDQEPLTLMRLRSDGTIVWRRKISPKLVLPQLAEGPNGDIYVVSQGGDQLAVHRFSSEGNLLGRTSIRTKQGSVAATNEGKIIVIYSIDGAGTQNRVYVAAFNSELKRLWTTSTPLRGKGGRTYQVVVEGSAITAIGDAEANDTAALIGIDGSGTISWKTTVPARISPPRLLPIRSGFYMVSTGTDGFTVSKQMPHR